MSPSQTMQTTQTARHTPHQTMPLHHSRTRLSLIASGSLLALLLAAPLQALTESSTPPAPADAPAPVVAPVPAATKASVERKAESLVRVNVTLQSYDFTKPWSKRPPFQRRAVGPVLKVQKETRVLVTAELVGNATYVELEKPVSGEKTPATVEVVDYECNLALIRPENPEFLKEFKPLTVENSHIGDTLAVWQVETNGSLLATQGLLTAAEVTSYPVDGNSTFLIYRLTSPLQPREGSFTIPVVNGNRLTGMLMRYDGRTQNADIIPAPVIAHFLKGAERKEGYAGFPRVGIGFSPLRDPQLRRYAGLKEGQEGVYITDVDDNGPAAKAGVKTGDVLLSVDGEAVDQDGNFDDPLYGKTSIAHLLSTHFPGAKVPVKIWRKSEEHSLTLELTPTSEKRSVIEPFTIDRAPRYYVLGGLVLQELSRQYLKEWGSDWYKKAPERFVYFDQYQASIFKDDPRERIVILSLVLPSPTTIGYEELGGQTVTAINGIPLKDLTDVDKALAASQDGFHRIDFAEAPKQIVLDAKEIAAIEAELLGNYGIPAVKNLD